MTTSSLPPSLPHAFLAQAVAQPDRPLLHFEDRTYTYGEVHQCVGETARSLHEWGLRLGDRVALYLENSPSFITAYLGVLWLGGVIVPVNTRYRETELRHMLTDSGARLVVTDAAGHAELEPLLPDVPHVERVVRVGEGLEPDRLAWRELGAGEPLREPVALTWDDLAVIGYTSGTTGRSKGAMLTHGNFVSNSLAVTHAWGWSPGDHLLLVLPLFHMHGLGVGFHGTLIQGSTITLKRKFDAREVLEELAQERVSMFFGVPTMYARLLEEARLGVKCPQNLRLLVSGSAPLSPQTLEAVEETFGLRILERYGMTETVMNLGNPFHGERKAGSVGVPFPGVEARVAHSSTGKVLRTSETGEIQLRGPNVFRGYWQNPEATRETFTPDGWFKTGDLGYRDQDGYYFLSGRARELIISGGFNVYPREVEEVLESHPSVTEAAVLGLPDPDFGERVVAVVVAPEGLEPDVLKQFCAERLAGFKKPREVFFETSLPRNALGKVQKHLLRDLLLRNAAPSQQSPPPR